MEINTTDLGKYFYVVNFYDFIANKTIKGVRKVRLIGILYKYKCLNQYLITFSNGIKMFSYDCFYRTKEDAEQKLKEIKKWSLE